MRTERSKHIATTLQEELCKELSANLAKSPEMISLLFGAKRKVLIRPTLVPVPKEVAHLPNHPAKILRVLIDAHQPFTLHYFPKEMAWKAAA